MSFTKLLCLMLIIVCCSVLVENRSYNNGLIFYNLVNAQAYLPPTISVSRGRDLAKFKYSPRGSIWSTFGKPCDCSGPLCACCVGIKVKQYKFDQKICANVSYAAPKDEIQLEVFLNETSSAKYGVAARNPSPLCIPIMMGIPMSMCIQMSNIAIQGDNLNMCMDFLVRLASMELFEMHFQCIKMGLQGVSWVGEGGQPVIPSSDSKIKHRNSEESDEYYDEGVDDTKNEVFSKETENENSNEKVTENNKEEDEDKNKAEEEMDYNDITEKVLDIAKEHEKEGETLEEVKENIIDNEIVKPDIKPESVTVNDETIKEETPASKENEVNKKEEVTNKQEILNELTENNLVIVEESKPTTIDLEEFDDYSDEIQTAYEPKPGSNESIDYDLNHLSEMEISSNATELNKETTNFETEEQNMIEKPEDLLTINHTERLQSETEAALDLEKFDMLINSKEEEETSELPQNESELNTTKEILNMPFETATEHMITDNFKPTIATTITTSETNNIENVDNALTTAIIMTTTTSTATTTTTMKTTSTTDDSAVAAASFIENNNNNSSNDSDKSHDNDSDYEDENEESDEEDKAEEEMEDNEETITTTIPNKENVNDEKNNVEILNGYENHSDESITKESSMNEESSASEISNASSSNESNSDVTENHDEAQDNYNDIEGAEEDDNEDSVESYEEEDEKDMETIFNANTNDIIDKTSAIANGTTDATIVVIKNQQLESTETAKSHSFSNNSLVSLSSSVSTSVATDSINNNSTSPNNKSEITTAAVVPPPLARTLFTLHRHNRHSRQH